MSDIRIDPTLYSGPPEDRRSPAEMRCYELLGRLAVPYQRADHEHADTIADCRGIEALLGTEICKNLFLRNRSGTQHYLLMMPGGRQFHTSAVSRALGVSRLSFAGAEEMEKLLGVLPGSVTVLGLMNDHAHAVQLVIDRTVIAAPFIGCHPCANTSTLKLRTSDLLERILPAIGVVPAIIDLPDGQ